MKKITAYSGLIFSLLIAVLIIPTGCYRKESFQGTPSPAPTVEPDPKTADIDSVSAASDNYYFENNSISSAELAEAIRNLSGGALAIATVNEDGSPNLAYAGPDIVTENILMFGLSENQTRTNIQERKLAVAGVYLFNEEKGGITASRGARLVLQLIEDSALIEELKKIVPDAPENALFMKIARILPVG